VIRDSYLTDITESDVGVGLLHPTATVNERLNADTVVMLGYNEPNRELYDLLVETGVDIHMVGDASGTRTLQAAMRSAAMLARGLVTAGAQGMRA
jgi:hypothetical protein